MYLTALFAPSDRLPDWIARFSTIMEAALSAVIVRDVDVVPPVVRVWTGSLNRGVPPTIATVECVLFEVSSAQRNAIEFELRKIAEPWLLAVESAEERLEDRLAPAGVLYKDTLLLLAGGYIGEKNEREWERSMGVKIRCPTDEAQANEAHRAFAKAAAGGEGLGDLLAAFGRNDIVASTPIE